MEIRCEKMIIAVLSGDTAADILQDLNENRFYATVLNSSGGFLRRKSVTLMIGLEESRLEEALQLLKNHAGTRMETTFLTAPGGASGFPAVPVKVQTGGVTVFVLNVERCEKY